MGLPTNFGESEVCARALCGRGYNEALMSHGHGCLEAGFAQEGVQVYVCVYI